MEEIKLFRRYEVMVRKLRSILLTRVRFPPIGRKVESFLSSAYVRFPYVNILATPSIGDEIEKTASEVASVK